MLGHSAQRDNVLTIIDIIGVNAMLEETARVVSLESAGRVRVATVRQSACGGCQGEQSCGSGVLATSARRSAVILAASNGLELKAGDSVVVGVPSGVLWQGMLLLYGMPLLLLAVCGMAGQILGGELGAVIGAMAGLVSGLLLAYGWSHKQPPDKYLPIVIKKGVS